MGILIGTILAVFSLAVVLVPFVRARNRMRLPQAAQVLEEVLERRQRLYQEMHTLQLDYQMGNIEEEEYRAQVRGRRLEAALLLKRQNEEEEKLEGLSQGLEEAIQAYRKSAARLVEVSECPNCGTPLFNQTLGCPECGANVKGESSPNHGNSVS